MQISDFKKKAFVPILLICILLVGELILSIALEPISYADYYNHDVRLLEESDTDADMIFVGASRVFRTYIPSVFEEKLGMDTIVNAGSALQKISGSYYLLQELLSEFNPSYVVLGVTGDALWNPYDAQSNLIVADRLSGTNKLSYLLDVFEPADYPYFFLKSYRYRENIGFGTIFNNVKAKYNLISSDYQYTDTQNNEYYYDSGFVYSNAAYEAGNVQIERPIENREEMNLDELRYLDKIVELCNSKGITLYLVTAPTTMMRIYNSEVYEEAHNWYTNYAKEHNLIYRNLNLLKNREELLPDTMMHDFNHVNGEGAVITSNIYADVLNATINGESTDNFFYSSLDELDEDIKRIIAVKADIEKSDNIVTVTADSLHSKSTTPLYSLEIEDESGKCTTVADWSQENIFTTDISMYKNCSIIIRAKSGTDGETVAFQRYSID